MTRQINIGDQNKNWQIVEELPKIKTVRYFLAKCLLCNNNYNIPIQSFTATTISFCCRSCAYSNDLTNQKFGKLLVIEKHHVKKNIGVFYLCKCDCGTEKIISSNHLQTKQTTSCGCYIKKMMANKIGNANPNWKGGITSKNIVERNYLTNTLNPIIRKRDNYTCQKCNKRGGKLNVHHIFNFSKYGELKYESFNLVTLCIDCHKEYHTIYGRKDNTLEQFETFIQTKYKYHEELILHFVRLI